MTLAMLLAQIASTDPTHVRDFIVMVGFTISSLAAAGTFVMFFLNGRRTQKREVTLADNFITTAECALRNGALLDRLQRSESGLKNEADARNLEVTQIFAKLNAVAEGFAGTKAVIEVMSQRLSVIESDVKRLIARRGEGTQP
jgi:hypothetical protein